jgi:hypothetical protein
MASFPKRRVPMARLLPDTIVPSNTDICDAAQSFYLAEHPWAGPSHQYSRRHLDILGRVIYKERVG